MARVRDDAAWRACGHAPGHPAMHNACLLGANNLLFQKNPNFLGNHSKFVGNAVKARACSSHGHAAKAKAAPMGTQPRPRQPPWAKGTQPRPVHVAALASHGQEARSQGPMGTLPRPKRHAANGHAAKAKAAPHGTQPRPRHAAKGKAEAPHGHMASGGHGGVSLQTERGKEF